MKNQITKNNDKHRAALDVVARFKANGGVVKEMPVTVGGKSNEPTNYGVRNKSEKL